VTELFAESLSSNLSSMGDILEDDSLPDPMEFLPPTEHYSPDLFGPNPARAEVFKGLTFIFMDEKTYNNLVLPINAGQGKAVEYDPTNQRVEDLVKFASNKGQVVLIQRNLDPKDELCLDAAKRYAPF
jgi:Second BRCT domain on Nijmegen syndrome breakage protein